MKNASVQMQLVPSTHSSDLTEVPKIAPVPFTKSTTESEVQEADIEVANVAAIHIYNKWCNKDFTIKELSSLFRTTVEFTKHRRKLLNLPYGAEESASGRKTIVYPLD